MLGEEAVPECPLGSQPPSVLLQENGSYLGEKRVRWASWTLDYQTQLSPMKRPILNGQK